VSRLEAQATHLNELGAEEILVVGSLIISSDGCCGLGHRGPGPGRPSGSGRAPKRRSREVSREETPGPDEVAAAAESSEATPSARASGTRPRSRRGGLLGRGGHRRVGRGGVAGRDAGAEQGGNGSGVIGGRRPWARASGMRPRSLRRRSASVEVVLRGGGRGLLGVQQRIAAVGIVPSWASVLPMPWQRAIEGEDRGRRRAWAFSRPEAARKRSSAPIFFSR
jgi:hypothetical protein